MSKQENTKAEYHIKFRELRTKIQMDIKENKKKYFQDYFEQNAMNIKETWRGIKSIVNINSGKKNGPSSLMVNNKLISDPNVVAETFNEYFSTIASKLQKKSTSQIKIFLLFFMMKTQITSLSNQQM